MQTHQKRILRSGLCLFPLTVFAALDSCSSKCRGNLACPCLCSLFVPLLLAVCGSLTGVWFSVVVTAKQCVWVGSFGARSVFTLHPLCPGECLSESYWPYVTRPSVCLGASWCRAPCPSVSLSCWRHPSVCLRASWCRARCSSVSLSCWRHPSVCLRASWCRAPCPSVSLSCWRHPSVCLRASWCRAPCSSVSLSC